MKQRAYTSTFPDVSGSVSPYLGISAKGHVPRQEEAQNAYLHMLYVCVICLQYESALEASGLTLPTKVKQHFLIPVTYYEGAVSTNLWVIDFVLFPLVKTARHLHKSESTSYAWA